MRYAVMSDVHANPAALATAVADARSRGCSRFVLLGDITGYGYDVKSALKLVRENFDVVLMGNHDSACLGLEPEYEVSSNRNYWVDVKQREELSEDELGWLRDCPYIHMEGDMAFVHGDFTNPTAWNYIFSIQAAVVSFFSRTERILFCGHTHHAAAWEMQGGKVVHPRLLRHLSHPSVRADTRSLALKDGSRYVVNVGSVGHPRADRCSTYVIYDSDVGRITFRRLPVDLVAYAAALSKAGIDHPLWLHDVIEQIAHAEVPAGFLKDILNENGQRRG